jgi:hypothetical protein
MGLKRGVLKKVAKLRKQTLSYRRRRVFVILPLFIKEKQGAKNPMTQHATKGKGKPKGKPTDARC